MTRHGIRAGLVALAAALAAPSIVCAYFPPSVGMPPVNVTGVPPDPFTPPTQGGLGEPEPPAPPVGPTVQTPEPASIVSAITGLALLAGYRFRKRAS